MNIYLICTGNTCRSPMAEAILRSKQLSGVEVRSAGLHAAPGMPISANAETLIIEQQLPYTAESRSVSSEDIEWADLILTMTGPHKHSLLASFPEAEGKTHTLKEYADPESGMDVQDPFGGNLETYRETFQELVRLLDKLEKKVTGEST